jgi:hypothetical protein
MEDDWFNIPGYPDYWLTKNGEIKRILKDGRHEKLTPREEYGSMKIGIFNEQKIRSNYTVQKYMAITFLEYSPNDDKKIDHVNGNRLDNRLENLTITSANVKAISATPRGYGTTSKKIQMIDPVTNEKLQLHDSVSDAIKWIIKNNPNIVISGKVENFISNNRKYINNAAINNIPCFEYYWEYETTIVDHADEIWIKTIHVGYDVSNYGYVRGPNKLPTNGHKTSVVSLVTEINGRSVTIHNLVAEAFMNVGNLDVKHKDGDKTNNHIDNLELINHITNLDNSRKIIQYDLELNPIGTFDSMAAAAEKLNLNRREINKCCLGDTDSVGEFIFKYV